jgi:pilus assembly protein CpaE
MRKAMNGVLVGRVRVLLLEDGQSQAERLRGILQGEDMDLIVFSGSIEEGLLQAHNWSPDVILVARPRDTLSEAIDKIDAAYNSTPVVALLTIEQAGNARDALLAGARAYLTADAGRDEVIDTILSVLEIERRRRTALAKRLGVDLDQGKVIALHGAKGGVGATTIAVNLAVAIRMSSRARVALVDANLYSGDVAAALNLMSRSNLADLTPHLKELDREFLQRAAVRHSSGVHTFLAPDDFVRAQVISGEQVARILKVMREHYDYIIVDTCSLPDPVTTAALDEADRIVLVFTPEVPALKNAARYLQYSGEFGHQGKITLALNRSDSRGSVGMGDIKTHLQGSIAVKISSEGRALIKAVNAGQPVVNRWRSRFARGIWQLAAVITGTPARQLRRAGKQQQQADQAENPTIPAQPRLRLLARMRPSQ